MLTERADIRQNSGESHRRWFSDDYFDLIVWFNESDDIILFQLGYDPDGVDSLFEWRPASGLSHFTVDAAGRRPARHARTPFLVPAQAPDVTALADRFNAQVGTIEPSIVDFVLDKLRR